LIERLRVGLQIPLGLAALLKAPDCRPFIDREQLLRGAFLLKS
jgi:hypothetical protein